MYRFKLILRRYASIEVRRFESLVPMLKLGMFIPCTFLEYWVRINFYIHHPLKFLSMEGPKNTRKIVQTFKLP